MAYTQRMQRLRRLEHALGWDILSHQKTHKRNHAEIDPDEIFVETSKTIRQELQNEVIAKRAEEVVT